VQVRGDSPWIFGQRRDQLAGDFRGLDAGEPQAKFAWQRSSRTN